MQGVPFSKANAIITEEWVKVKASNKEMKRYRDLYKEEKLRHEEALQRHEEDHMDEMEITNLHKRNKARKTPQPKKAPNSPKSDEPKKRSSDGKRIAGKAGKRTVGKTPQPKKAPKSAEFIGDSSKEEEEKEPKKIQAMEKYHTAEKSTKVT